ncbi:MAG TPA: polyribonucleotide nucleotidyltransferase [Candidatus Paceibacterota bacterium]|mgnify:FL=1|nr:polyribonucleotide nucleotidyltransferase [Candidatus Paceibacterota bacterium]HQI25842.1 polyribonucleotide nucleotidyltransferase [Candidatus Paceibacterota bacterium]
MQKKEYSLEVGGRALTATFTNLADQTNGSVLIGYGDTLILATAVMGKNKREDIDYFPLTVEYEERYYAAGKIGGARFVKREGRPSEEAVLSGRIVDRTIRPLFNSSIRNEIQVVLTVLALDENNDADVPAVIGASLALATSDIPWGGPVGAMRLGLANDSNSDFIINPTFAERADCQLDLLVCAKDGHINMIETEAKEIAEDKIGEGFELAVAEINKIEAWQKQIITEIGQAKREMETPIISEEAKTLFADNIQPKIDEVIFETTSDGSVPKKSADSLKEEWLALRAEKMPEANLGAWLGYFEEVINDRLHDEAINNNRRPDGRGLTEIRPLYAQAGGFSNVVHGVGLFYRGATHVLTTLTLSGPKDSLIVEGMEVDSKKFFMHHYNFPPFSVGETGRVGSPSRRSIGHGALAEKSLRGVIPSREVFPYTIRLVSEVFASNGSSSQASVCASTLALMDGGVPIKAPVAGISIGLMMKDENTYRLITDIQGLEDHYGDMDFKVAGTTEGITGIQLDIKTAGIPIKILVEALAEAKKARTQILAAIQEAIPAPRPEISPSAPKIIQITIPVDKIGAVIGSGGKTIQEISEKNNVEIEIEDDGTVYITGKIDGANNAKAIIEDMTREYKAGDRFEGEVVRLMDFGAFVKIGHDTDGLIHISELAPFRVEKVTDIVQLGEKVPVVVKEVDERGRINLSLKSADPDFAKKKGIVPKNPPTKTFGHGG